MPRTYTNREKSVSLQVESLADGISLRTKAVDANGDEIPLTKTQAELLLGQTLDLLRAVHGPVPIPEDKFTAELLEGHRQAWNAMLRDN
jgi:hypothetical protein